MSTSNLATRIRRYPSAVLLAAQLLALVLYPFIENTDVGRIGFGIFGIVVLGVTTRMVQRTPFVTWIGVGIALPAIVLLALQMVFDWPQLLIGSSALESLFYFYAAGSLIAYMLADRRATPDELMFLSFALLSSTGIGDIIPIRAPARGLASIEMFVGVMYLASVVTRLIGLTLQRHGGDER